MTGYAIAVVVNLVLVYLVVVEPGWRAVPFLTEDFSRVVGLLTFSFLVSIAANLVYLVFDPRWARYLGEAITASVGFGVLVRLVQVFPFEFSPAWAGWETPLRVLLVLACVGTAIGALTNLAYAVRALGAPSDDR